MTLYGDLEISVIDELPKGRRPIQTSHLFDSQRLKVNGFIRSQIDAGRQVYVVYPLIEESKKLDLKHLMDGYESMARAFPDVPISIVHGQMKPKAKDFEMARFVKGETKIMVATTVIEVGVDVPNASVMIVESAERFGLAQLHQLRGRIGRGAQDAHCILIAAAKSREARQRLRVLEETTDGFKIAEADLKLRGPGEMLGQLQSGAPRFRFGDLAGDLELIKMAREMARELVNDPAANGRE